MPAPQRIRTIIRSRELFDKLRPHFGREALDLTTATSGRGVLPLRHHLDFRRIVVEHPLPDMDLAELIPEIRDSACRSSRAPVAASARRDPVFLAAGQDDGLLSCRALEAGVRQLLPAIADDDRRTVACLVTDRPAAVAAVARAEP